MDGKLTLEKPSENFQHLCNARVLLVLVDEMEKDVVDGAADERTQIEKLSVDTMKSGFEEVALAWIFTVE